jgi:hypothetical protein
MRGFRTSSFDPQTLVVLETAFDEAWFTLKSIGTTTVKPDELARCVLRLAMEGERDPARLRDDALQGVIPATAWRERDLDPPLPAALDCRGIGPPLKAQARLICYNLLARGPRPSDFIWEVSTMSHAKQVSKRRSRAKAVTVLGVAGTLSLAAGASAVSPTVDTPTENTAITLGEEEISDVSLATFYVFDNENAGAHRPGVQFAKARSH